MRRGKGTGKSGWIGALFFLLSPSIFHGATADVRIGDYTFFQDRLILTCPADEDAYCILLYGEDLSSLSNAVDMGLGGTHASTVLSDGPLSDRPNTVGFYAVLAVPAAMSLDTDGDGMDDVFELLNDPLDPLNAADALEDPDGDGVINRIEYLQGRDPLKGAVQDTGDFVSLHVYTPLE